MNASYRLYCLDGHGAIALADWLQAASDDDAIAQARAMKGDPLTCEIWQKDRLVRRLGADARSIKQPVLSPESLLCRGSVRFQ